MIYLYYGENSLMLQAKLLAQKERYQAKFKSGLNFWRLDLEEDFQNLKSIIASQSMFEEKKLVFLRGILSLNESEWQAVAEILKEPGVKSGDVILVFYDFILPSASGREAKPNLATQKRIKFFSENGQVEEFKNLPRPKLITWATAKAKELGADISKTDLEYLADIILGDQQRLLNELKKLASYKSEKITRADIDFLVSPEISANIFKTTEALANRDLKTALLSLEDHWHKNEEPLGVLSMLIWQFRILVKMASLNARSVNEVSAKLKLNNWTAQKSFNSLKHFNFEELKNAYQHLADIDLAVKTGSSDAKEALTDFVYSFLPRSNLS